MPSGTSAYITSRDGVRLHIETHDYTDPWKKAPILILQHGFGRSGRFWYNMIPYLSRFYRVVCPDLRGLGQSSRDFDLATGLSINNYLSDILCIADCLGAQTFHYAGESLGGVLGMALAANHPDRVRTLTLMTAPLRPGMHKGFAFGYPSWQDALRQLGAREWSKAMNTATRFPPGTDPGLLDWYSDEVGKCDVDVMIAMSVLAPTVDVTPLLCKIKAPTLGLYPTGGPIATSGQEDTLKTQVANIRIVNVPTSYHMVWVVAPAACAEHMLHFMAANDGVTCRER